MTGTAQNAQSHGRSPEPKPALSLDQFYRRMFELAFELALKLLKNREAANEVAQDVWGRLWNKWKGIPEFPGGIAEADRYAAQTTRWCAVDYVRCQNREWGREADIDMAELPAGWADAAQESAAIAIDLAYRFAVALNKMTTERRETYCRFMDDGLTYAEIAAERGISVRTVACHVANAMSVLREVKRAYDEERTMMENDHLTKATAKRRAMNRAHEGERS